MQQLYYLLLFIFLFNISNTYCQNYDAKLIELYFANDGYPEGFKEASTGFYFTAKDPIHGRELRFSDGTIEKTYLVKDLAEGERDSNVQTLAVLGDLLFFNASPDLGSIPIVEFKHPKQGCYILGAEDSGLPLDVIEECTKIVKLPGERSLNLAVAGSIVLFDRIQKAIK